MRSLSSLFVLLCIGLHMEAQNTLDVLVTDAQTHEPIIGASLLLSGANLSASTDVDGRARLTGIKDDLYQLRTASIGYRTLDTAVRFPRGTALFLIPLVPAAGELEEVVVSATRTNSRIDDAPQKIEVLGEEELHEESSLKPGNIASLIGDISSVQIQQTSAVSGASTVRMQGLDGRYTLLLRDGMPAFGGLSGGFDLLRMPPLDLQRVEMLKGPSSTFNGGGAIAGAINFVSKTPTDSLSGLALLNASSLHERNVNLYLSGPLGKVGFTLFGGSTFQEAVDVNGDGYSDVARARTHILHPQLFLKPGKNGKLRIGALLQDDDRIGGAMDAIDMPADTARYFHHTHGRRGGADLTFDQSLSKTASLTVKGAVNSYEQSDKDNFFLSKHGQANLYAEAYWSQHTDKRTWVLGANYVGNQLAGDSIEKQDLSVLGAFAQLALHRDRWPEIDLGLRVDQPTGFDVQVLPSAAAMYKASKQVTLRANAGSGYQLPDRSRNYGLATQGVLASRTVKGTLAEGSFGGTVEWTWTRPLSAHAVLFVDQTFFATQVGHPLAIGASEGSAVLLNPGGSTFTRGIDNYVRLKIDETEIYFGYTWTLPERTLNGITLLVSYTPQHRAATTLSHEFSDHWRAGVEASWSGEQDRGDGTMTRDQLFMAAMVGYKQGRWSAVLNGENITDTRQTRWERIVSGSASRPVFAPLWAPIDGRVINLSVLFHFGWMKK